VRLNFLLVSHGPQRTFKCYFNIHSPRLSLVFEFELKNTVGVYGRVGMHMVVLLFVLRELHTVRLT
jgi:hypothetical protein